MTNLLTYVLANVHTFFKTYSVIYKRTHLFTNILYLSIPIQTSCHKTKEPCFVLFFELNFWVFLGVAKTIVGSLLCCVVDIVLCCGYCVVVCVLCYGVGIVLWCGYCVVMWVLCCGVDIVLWCGYCVVVWVLCCDVGIVLWCGYCVVLWVLCCGVAIVL